jgi:single-stranded-DNA-specific exonuclease
MQKRWKIAEIAPPEYQSSIGGAHPLVAQLLWNRGIRVPEEVEAFLHPSWKEHIHDERNFARMAGAVERVFSALENHERITVHGDYDADGVTGATVIITTLREIEKIIERNAQSATSGVMLYALRDSLIDYYIPHRDKEGYGLHLETVTKLKERGTTLIITVDCGISCVEEIAFAKSEGLDAVVVDHHQFGEIVPDAHLIHPGLPDETYPFKSLAAVGVAYKFANALLTEARGRGLSIADGWEKWLLDLVAIATVTDMVPLIGENRVLEKYGLSVLNKTRRPGLLAILEKAGVAPGTVTSQTVGFTIGPRLNAAGRMDHASLALRLLLSESMDEARLLASELEQLNKSRQVTTKKMMEEAEEILDANHMHPQTADCKENIIVLWKERWSPALVGLVAGRLADRFARPVIAIGFHEKHWIGSGRSIPSYNITEAVKSAGEGILTRSGGHAAACGFSFEDTERLPELRDRLVEHAASIAQEDLVPLIEIDAELPLSAVTMEMAERIASLEPYGMGNPRPVFVSRRCRLLSRETMGSTNAHIRLSLLDESGRKVKAVGFRMGERLPEILDAIFVDVAYEISTNEWNGRRTVECRLVDVVASKR